MGYGTSAETRAVAINAGALFLAAGMAETIRDGTELALRTIGSGEPAKRLKQLVAISNG